MSAEEIRADIAALPAYDDSDGLSTDEILSLEMLLGLGRQLTFAQAAETLEDLLAAAPEGIRLASAGSEIDFEVLEALRTGC